MPASKTQRVAPLVFLRPRSARRNCLSPKTSSSKARTTMHILVADLNEDAAAFGQKFPRNDQPITQIRQIAVDAVLPGIPERLDLLRLARQPRPCPPSRRACACSAASCSRSGCR